MRPRLFQPRLGLLAFALIGLGCSKSSSPGGGATGAASAAPGALVASGSAAAPAGSAPGAGGPGDAPRHSYEIKSGVVAMTNSMMPGMTSTLYFDDFGARQNTVTQMETKMLGQVVHTDHWSITADGFHIDYDADKKTGRRRKLGAGVHVPKPPGAPAIDVEALMQQAKSEASGMKLQELPAKTIGGKIAKGFAMDAMGFKVRTWIWKGLALYTETEMGAGKPLVVEATSVQEVDVPADRFTVPPDAKITDVGM